MSVQSTIHFYGGAGTVTGSNFLLDTGSAKFLIDCGLFQGEHAFDDENWKPFPFDPSSITHLINTHAHIDHIGRIPKLVKDGYRGRILSTEATKALAEPMLLDAMELSRKTAQKIGKEPLYDEEDIVQALSQWDTVPYHEPVSLADGMTVEFLNSGHIL
ncbi:MBL fold metallo-hydrolase, partial [Patescibacteria group bacterium]|nr:MBL fold metallo-hydrolase [Patescibacteria group bacterium]